MASVVWREVSKTFDDGTTAVDSLSLHARDGELLVLVGPSGSGKSTALRLLAGLDDPTSGDVLIGDRVVTSVPPERRDVAMVFQSLALYPHMSVHDKIAYPLVTRKVGTEERRRKVRETARLLGIEELLPRRPSTLSGGQRQRVAMGRAIVRSPAVFLMDEPLSSLDAKLRVELRGEIALLQRRLETTTIYVTHDQVEAMTLGQRVAVLDEGRLLQVGTPEELYHDPDDAFVGGFIGSPGMNLIACSVEPTDDGMVASIAEERIRLEIPGDLRDAVWSHGEPKLLVGVRPEAVTLSHAGSGEASGESVRGSVANVEVLGHEQLVHVELADNLAPVVARADRSLDVALGTTVTVSFDPAAVYLFASDGRRIRSGST